MSEPPHQILSGWAEGEFPHSYLDPALFFTDMDLSGPINAIATAFAIEGFRSQPLPVPAPQPAAYERGYTSDDLSQYSAAFAWRPYDSMLEPEAICHAQNITNTTFPSLAGDSPTEVSLSYDAKVVDVSTTHVVSEGNENAEESEYICAACGKSFPNRLSLMFHSKYSGHLSYRCGTAGCSRTFAASDKRDAHQTRPHILGHGRTITATPYDCVQCLGSFRSKANLLRHGKESQHHPYACECGAFFSRLDVLNRHLDSLGTDDPKYPCQYCKRHRGADGFRRKDHLMQHIRNYHHHEIDETGPDVPSTSKSRLAHVFPVCSYENCPQFRDAAFKQLPRRAQDANKPFASLSAYTKHMREEHNECMFPCDISGCDRVGRRGYFREKDLLKHRTKEHPDAFPYQVTKRNLRHHCTTCDKDLDPSSLNYHSLACYRQKHPQLA